MLEFDKKDKEIAQDEGQDPMPNPEINETEYKFDELLNKFERRQTSWRSSKRNKRFITKSY